MAENGKSTNLYKLANRNTLLVQLPVLVKLAVFVEIRAKVLLVVFEFLAKVTSQVEQAILCSFTES